MARHRTLSLITAGVQKNGKPVDMTILNQVVKNHCNTSRPPVSLGHPDKGADKVAALGRVNYPRIDGNELVVELVYTPELEALEDSGKFEGFSAGIYPRPDNGEYYLHHVAALGQLPPAADIQTKDVVELADYEPENVITLACSMKSELFMNEEEKAAFKKEIQGLVTETVKTALAASGAKPTDDKTKTQPSAEDDDKNKAPGVSAELLALQENVKNMQESTKADRVAQITELADTKGLSKEEKEPLLALLKKTAAIELCDNSDDGIFASTKKMLAARPDANSASSGGGNSDLFKPLEFANHQGGTTKVDNLSELAIKTGF